MKDIYENYAAYNLWANRRLAEVFESLPNDLLVQEIVSSFPSVLFTFLHIWDAEHLWLKRLQGESPFTYPSRSFDGEPNEVFDVMLQTSTEFFAFVSAQPASFFDETIEFVTITMGGGSQRAGDVVLHCMNHSTYHRGQLVTLGRQLGIEKFPPTDYIFYIRG